MEIEKIPLPAALVSEGMDVALAELIQRQRVRLDQREFWLRLSGQLRDLRGKLLHLRLDAPGILGQEDGWQEDFRRYALALLGQGKASPLADKDDVQGVLRSALVHAGAKDPPEGLVARLFATYAPAAQQDEWNEMSEAILGTSR